MGCGFAYFNNNLQVLLSGLRSLAVSLNHDRWFSKPFLIRRYNITTLLEEGGLKGLSLWTRNRAVQRVTTSGVWTFLPPDRG